MADKWGMTAQGFNRPRIVDIKNKIESDMSHNLGFSIDTSPQSAIGVLNGIMAVEFGQIWEAVEAAYYAMYPHTAEGVQLDNAVAFGGVKRLGATKTKVTLYCTGTPQTVIAAKSTAQCEYDNKNYFCIHDRAISNSEFVDCVIKVADCKPGAEYSINLESVLYKYVSGTAPTPHDILLGLKNAILNDKFDITVTDDTMNIVYKKTGDTATISASSNLFIPTVTTPVLFVCDYYGEVIPPPKTITRIITPVVGWQKVTNIDSGITGNDEESDQLIRQRYITRLFDASRAEVESLKAHVLATVQSVDDCLVVENDADVVDINGLPPHSVEVVVESGLDAEIAQAVFEKKAAGITAYGETYIQVKDSQGEIHEIGFSRPQPRKVWIKCTVKAEKQKVLQGDAVARTRNAIYDYGKTLTIHLTVVLLKFYNKIFEAVPNVGEIEMLAAVGETQPKPEDYKAENIVMSHRQKATFDLSRIEVVTA